MLSINTNLSNLIAQNSLKSVSSVLNQAAERLTTGYKINSAKDNAANYSISTNMTTKIGAYQVAEDNAAKGLDMVVSASENLSLIEDKLTRLRDLATQTLNGTYGRESLKTMQSEANAITKEIERLYSSATFNDIKLLDDSPEIPEGIGLAKDLTPKYDGFIKNPVDYTPGQIANMDKLSSVNPNTSISSGQYSISSAKELKQLADMTNSGKITGGEFVLACDIDLSEYSDGEGWKPISVWLDNCTFNGNGNIITGLKINRPTEEDVGLFKTNVGKIKNLGIEDCDIIGGVRTGTIAGSTRYTTAIIDNCYSIGTAIGTKLVGGITGYIYNASCNSSYSNVDVTSTTSVMHDNAAAGGMIGQVQTGTVEDCFAIGNIYSHKDCSGGFIGIATSCTVTNCYATGDVSNDSVSQTGGFIGDFNGTLRNCYSTGNVYGSGGLLGSMKGSSTIIDCYSTGNIYASGSYIGGLIGLYSGNNALIENCRAYGDLNNSSTMYYSGGLIGRIVNKTSTLTIKNAITYSKFLNPTKTYMSGSFIGVNENTADGSSFGTLNIENCGAVEQGLKKLDCYIYEGGVYKTWSYDGLDDLLAGVKTVQKPKQEISLQIGTQGDSASQIDFNSKVDTRLFNKIKKIDITDSNSIQDLDNILQSINEKQTSLGTSQNRLESVLEEVAVQYENLVSSRSTLRDADIAIESAKMIQAQILQQASATLMASSRNVRQENVLGLLQGLRR